VAPRKEELDNSILHRKKWTFPVLGGASSFGSFLNLLFMEFEASSIGTL
jgi:hypothetical protein